MDPKGTEVIMLGDLNERLQEPRETREKDLETVLEDSGLVNMNYHFMPRRRYRGAGSWTWKMRREGRQVMGRGK